MSMKKMTPSQLLFLSLLLPCFTSLAFGQNTTDPAEVEALKDIGNTLGNKNWDTTIDPCSNKPPWSVTMEKDKANYVRCNCSIPTDTYCHVVSITLKAQNLTGTLPSELTGLPHLEEIDLTRNYLNGTIPIAWGSSKLRIISLLGNRLTGPIPKEIGNITTLESLVLEFNQFTGNITPELGNLSHLQRLHLTSNNFTGELPETLAKLTLLRELRLNDNNFSGSIPSFIQRWTNLEILEIQGSGLSGPIPSQISLLHNLYDLRITDLINGSDSTFPQINNMTNLKTLILRNCQINDELPSYLGYMKGIDTTMQTLDLSFNKLRGNIPENIGNLSKLSHVYFTGNQLTGPLPKWVAAGGKPIDLSYNNFTDKNSSMACQENKEVNWFASFPMSQNGPITCLSRENCTRLFDSFHINCGGEQQRSNENIMYDEDFYPSGAATSEKPKENWAFSNTGHFLGGHNELAYIQQSQNTLSMPDSVLYQTARVSPISLTYYGMCLKNGDYIVSLHFAEIMFTDDNSYSSLGRRIFDVYIQGKLELKDFNIANEAGGVGKNITKRISTIVTNNSLEIRFYWAGKGTTSIPYRSVYGPLISAISVTHVNTTVPNNRHPNISGITIGVVIGIVLSAMVFVILILLGWRLHFAKRNSLAKELNHLNLQVGLFTMRQIKVATNNFDISNKIGEGGFGPVYKGTLSDDTIIAVKKLSSKSKQGNREFINEIGLISALQHPCLVKLYGCCVEGDQLLLVYEYMENNSLAHALFRNEESCLQLDWPTRYKICVGIARGLVFLHEESRLKVVHRDIKATNVLLDKDLNPKISDFGLAKLDDEDNTHISTRIAGTYGYMAPEYAMHGYLTDKADIYSFGVVILEIVTGNSNTIPRPKQEALHLLDWAHFLKEKGNLMELVDRRLGSNFNEKEVMMMIKVGLLCTNAIANLRPSMSTVLGMLEGKTVIPEFISDSSEIMDENKLEAMRQFYSQMEENQSNETHTNHSSSKDGSWIASPSSTSDLYPLHTDSSYWEKRN
ncbi:probable leucine-rich repeat receptor-like serine/threonine-protein kinase At3g14840 [Vigna unguiculata]|uniref:probable leucine-rich repeat receptor-like serine/threonine-protein kinase At3g14840 n=1 Tax=Vigna unguiculata TaxID=3917 RepID=UPI00101625DC|nr:probable leucine-rich repeat receptor-like serine/threonine-protein kinase At3g14840 [Vigna unguiculata]